MKFVGPWTLTNALFIGKNQHLWLLFMHCSWTVVAKFDFSHFFQQISAHCALFTDPQISLFNYFFIKNGSHDTIHTFKNYFVIVFFSFQFSAVSKWTLSNRLGTTETQCICISMFFFFLYWEARFSAFQWVLCTVHGTYKAIFQQNFH